MFETKEQVNNYFSGEKIECLLCGKEYKALACHIIRVHKTSPDNYRGLFGLPLSRGLVAEDTRDKQAASLVKRKANGDKSLTDIGKVAHLGQQTKNRPAPIFAKKERSKRFSKIGSAKKATRDQIIAVIDEIENTGKSKYTVCLKPGFITNKTFNEGLGRYKDLNKRFTKVNSNRLSCIEQKTGMTRHEILEQVKTLSADKTSRQICELLGIGSTTLKRIKRGEGAWSED